ncbi:hypothetical protein RvY_17614 [Ramazzottius varieornatus]|uniref:Uncharacterized protein n=1 Tax=Ramazzottius varieornatus TaxID=947166 RepID=A0A1D1W8I3_RAMVA|nr:hypothetical protein RvY_17614 [Ramazzottius varieornatus]
MTGVSPAPEAGWLGTGPGCVWPAVPLVAAVGLDRFGLRIELVGASDRLRKLIKWKRYK